MTPVFAVGKSENQSSGTICKKIRAVVAPSITLCLHMPIWQAFTVRYTFTTQSMLGRQLPKVTLVGTAIPPNEAFLG